MNPTCAYQRRARLRRVKRAIRPKYSLCAFGGWISGETMQFILRLYSVLFKITGLYYIIDKYDFLFNVYVIPHRIYHILRRRKNYGFSYMYIWDVLSKRQLKNRRGACTLCGACCKGCSSLIEKNGVRICSIYRRRTWCDVYFPISPEQLEFVIKLHNIDCGYYFISPGQHDNE